MYLLFCGVAAGTWLAPPYPLIKRGSARTLPSQGWETLPAALLLLHNLRTAMAADLRLKTQKQLLAKADDQRSYLSLG
jgi:hypothetical protein